MIRTRFFGRTKEGKEVLAFTISDGRSSVTVLNYGALIHRLVVPAKDGRLTDIVLGYRTVKEYEEHSGRMGAVLGRCANRIGGGKFTLDGVTYELSKNDGKNHRHGGFFGFDKKVWSYGIKGNTLALSIVSPDGEEGYPGNLKATVVYTFREGVLRIHYRAESDKKTAVSLTNHVYFNLNGESSGSALGNELMLSADEVVELGKDRVPTGRFVKVAGTAYDFNETKTVGRDLGKAGAPAGYDDCYVLRVREADTPYAVAYGKATGIEMRCYTDMPAVQLYSAGGLDWQGKWCRYAAGAGFCLETEAIPNNVNQPAYAEKGSSVLDAGEKYDFFAEYHFGLRK